MTNDRKIVTLDDLERRGLQEHRKPYYDWIRQVVTLSTAALTALIALQANYLPSQSKAPFLLASSWLALLLTIILGMVALRTEYSSLLESAIRIRSSRQKFGDIETKSLILNGALAVVPHWHHRWAVRLMVLSFILALCSLCAFAIVNIGGVFG